MAKKSAENWKKKKGKSLLEKEEFLYGMSNYEQRLF